MKWLRFDDGYIIGLAMNSSPEIHAARFHTKHHGAPMFYRELGETQSEFIERVKKIRLTYSDAFRYDEREADGSSQRPL
ncbi:hypothetical protein [Thiomicrorhabdus indica]|uniref:hypothetical protein n=1 Tax=Thiomicrorhabdus indica TaxID=2267253 RepID=UPI002AA6E32F|nr:hypothetical protein [Thiomicrorhabdus indica]